MDSDGTIPDDNCVIFFPPPVAIIVCLGRGPSEMGDPVRLHEIGSAAWGTGSPEKVDIPVCFSVSKSMTLRRALNLRER